MLVAEGGMDLAAEPELALHDMAAVSVVVDEAGGRFTSLDGSPGPNGGNALATNGRLHEQVMAFIGSLPDDQLGTEPSSGGQVHQLSARRQRMAAEHAEDADGDDE
jgi:histidinol-phosphatase